MTPTTTTQPALNEERWNEWIEKGERHDLATARRLRIALAFLLCLGAAGFALYIFWLK